MDPVIQLHLGYFAVEPGGDFKLTPQHRHDPGGQPSDRAPIDISRTDAEKLRDFLNHHLASK